MKKIEEIIKKYEAFLKEEGHIWIGPLEGVGYCRAIKDVIKDLKELINEKD